MPAPIIKGYFMILGIVKFYNSDKGSGFVQPNEG
jgi:hypothetical protein